MSKTPTTNTVQEKIADITTPAKSPVAQQPPYTFKNFVNDVSGFRKSISHEVNETLPAYCTGSIASIHLSNRDLF